MLEREFAHHIEEQFSLETRELSIRIQERMTTYQQILRDGRGLFTASENVTREEWRDYVKSLNLEMDYQGILGVGFAINLSPKHLDAHIRAVQTEGFPNYVVWPPGQRSNYSAIIYLEPFTGRNLRAFGYDMLSEAVRRTAMEKAQDSSMSVLSGKVRLVQETETDIQTGVLLYLPIYHNGAPSQTLSERRAALLGWIYSPFRMNDLMRGVLGRVSETTHLRIYDGEQETDEALLYDSHAGLTDILSLTVRTPIEIAGHIWTLRYTALPGFVAEQKGHEPLRNTVVLGMIDLLLFVIVWLLSHSRQRAEDMAEQLTVSLRESENRYRNLAQAASDAIITIDDQDMIISWNPSSARTCGYTAAEMLGKPLTPIIPECYRALHQAGLARFRANGKSRLIGQTLELEGLRLDGTTFPIELALSTWQSNGRQYFTAIIRDISERKKTEDLIRYQASYDPLTGLPNRRLFHDRLHAEITRAVRLQNVLALLFMDLDHFKEVNDSSDMQPAMRCCAKRHSECRAVYENRTLSPVWQVTNSPLF